MTQPSITKILIALFIIALIGVGIYFFSTPEKPQEKAEENLPLFEVEGEVAAPASSRSIPPPLEDDESPEGLWE